MTLVLISRPQGGGINGADTGSDWALLSFPNNIQLLPNLSCRSPDAGKAITGPSFDEESMQSDVHILRTAGPLPATLYSMRTTLRAGKSVLEVRLVVLEAPFGKLFLSKLNENLQ
jgi:hypothetical protein